MPSITAYNYTNPYSDISFGMKGPARAINRRKAAALFLQKSAKFPRLTITYRHRKGSHQERWQSLQTLAKEKARAAGRI